MSDRPNNYSNEASRIIEAFLATTPHPTAEQWKALTFSYPEHAAEIADTALVFYGADDADDVYDEADTELFSKTHSIMLNALDANTAPVAAAKIALNRCKGPAARRFAEEIGLGKHISLFTQMLRGELKAPYVLIKRLAAKLDVRVAAVAEVFNLNFASQSAQSFKSDNKPLVIKQPTAWGDAVKAAGISGDEAQRLMELEKEID